MIHRQLLYQATVLRTRDSDKVVESTVLVEYSEVLALSLRSTRVPSFYDVSVNTCIAQHVDFYLNAEIQVSSV